MATNISDAQDYWTIFYSNTFNLFKINKNYYQYLQNVFLKKRLQNRKKTFLRLDQKKN